MIDLHFKHQFRQSGAEKSAMQNWFPKAHQAIVRKMTVYLIKEGAIIILRDKWMTSTFTNAFQWNFFY